LVFHLLKEHPFWKSGKEIHEFCVLKCDARWLNHIKVWIETAKSTTIDFELTSEVPPFDLPYMYILMGGSFTVYSLVTG